MPVQHAYTMKAGTKSKLLLVYATSADSTSGKTGLARNVSAGSAAYIREGESAARRVPIVEGRVGEWGSGAFAEVDSELLPGVYQFGAPDEMIAEGSARAVLLIRFPDTVIKPVEINLVGIAEVYRNGTGVGRAGRERTKGEAKHTKKIVSICRTH